MKNYVMYSDPQSSDCTCGMDVFDPTIFSHNSKSKYLDRDDVKAKLEDISKMIKDAKEMDPKGIRFLYAMIVDNMIKEI